MLKKVKVKIGDDPKGHRHAGREVEPGEVIEVWPRQALFLQELGVAAPYHSAKGSRQSRSTEAEAEAEGESPPEEVSEESTTGGGEDSPADE